MNNTAFGSTESLTQLPSPGSASEDDPRVVAALKEYLAALDDGQCPDRAAFLERHGDIAPLLARCLDGLELVHGAASGLPAATGGGLNESACPPNATLGDFRLIRMVGRGAMGVVYE